MQPFYYFLNFLKTIGIFSCFYMIFYWESYRIDSPFLWIKNAHVYILLPFIILTSITWLFPKIHHWVITFLTACSTSAVALFMKLLLIETGAKEYFYLTPLIKISRIWNQEEKLITYQFMLISFQKAGFSYFFFVFTPYLDFLVTLEFKGSKLSNPLIGLYLTPIKS